MNRKKFAQTQCVSKTITIPIDAFLEIQQVADDKNMSFSESVGVFLQKARAYENVCAAQEKITQAKKGKKKGGG